MKIATALKISLLLLFVVFLASCSSSKHRPIYRSSVPEHCNSPNVRNPTKVQKKPQAPPGKQTPIGGMFSVRQ
jgi:PBP1b-binding outer membrane lipoprotein LpoB